VTRNRTGREELPADITRGPRSGIRRCAFGQDRPHRTRRIWFNRSFPDGPEGSALSADTPQSTRKARIDALLLELPGGTASTREWIQINRADAAGYEKDRERFQASLELVKAGRPR